MSNNNDVVIDRGQSKISDLWTKEDYWAIWIGFFIFAVAVFLMWPSKGELATKIDGYNQIIAVEKEKPFKTVALIEAQAAKGKVVASATPEAKALTQYLVKASKWTTNPLDSLVRSEATAAEMNKDLIPQIDAAKENVAQLKKVALVAEQAAAAAQYKSADINAAAEKAVSVWQAESKALAGLQKKMAKAYNVIPELIVLGIILAVITSVGMFVMGQPVIKYIIGFAGVYVLCVFATVLGKQATMSYYGVGAEIWAIAIGMIIANTVGTPKWLLPGVQVEYYIKAGLVLLGGEVLFHKILAIGIPGIFVAWVVTPIVLVVTYIFGQKVLKIESKTLNIVISSDMSVCGTSAAIAAASACRAKKEELTLAIGISLTFTAIMMIAMPAFIKLVGMPEVLAGAWIGGTVDATGAVAAAGAFIGPKAMQVAATIKMIQNVMIGITAFCIALYWCTYVDRQDGCHEKVGLMEVWHRFPKFVIGFIACSIIFSYFAGSYGPDLGYAMVDKGALTVSKGFRGWFFALSFISIGLATNFRELTVYLKGGKPIILYVCGQSFNLALTLAMAYLMFYVVFPEITASI